MSRDRRAELAQNGDQPKRNDFGFFIFRERLHFFFLLDLNFVRRNPNQISAGRLTDTRQNEKMRSSFFLCGVCSLEIGCCWFSFHPHSDSLWPRRRTTHKAKEGKEPGKKPREEQKRYYDY